MGRHSIHKLREWKAEGRRFAMITAYDYPSARLVEQAGIPIILVGDSLGSVVLGYESTVPVTMDDILYHTRAVVRATFRVCAWRTAPRFPAQFTREQAAGHLRRTWGWVRVAASGWAA